MGFTKEEIESFTQQIWNIQDRWDKCEFGVDIKVTRGKQSETIALFTSHGYLLSNYDFERGKLNFLYGPFGLEYNPKNGCITVKQPIIPLAPEVLKKHREFYHLIDN